jgi:hypothetical protein
MIFYNVGRNFSFGAALLFFFFFSNLKRVFPRCSPFFFVLGFEEFFARFCELFRGGENGRVWVFWRLFYRFSGTFLMCGVVFYGFLWFWVLLGGLVFRLRVLFVCFLLRGGS